jgi:hypothetical protein
MPTAIMTPNDTNNAFTSAHITIDFTMDVCLPPTAHQRAVVTQVMTKVWGILYLREFQVEAVARLVF